MLIEYSKNDKTILIEATKVVGNTGPAPEKPENPGFLSRVFEIEDTTNQIEVHYEGYDTLGAISNMDGREKKIFDISYQDFKDYAQICASDPTNPLNIIDMKDDVLERIPEVVQNWRAKNGRKVDTPTHNNK